MLVWLYWLLRSISLRGFLVIGILILVIGILMLVFPDSMGLILGIGFIVIVVISVLDALSRR
jgi:hypothetical protein